MVDRSSTFPLIDVGMSTSPHTKPHRRRENVAHGARACEKIVAAGLSRHRGSENTVDMAG